MKVYILTEYGNYDDSDEEGYSEILGVFATPKLARIWFDEEFDIHTRRKWKKYSAHGFRFYDLNGLRYFITEFAVQKA